MFRSHVKVRFVPSEDDATLERLLVHAWESSRERWPTVALPAEPFVKHVAERLPEAAAPGPVESLLAGMSLAELYLACACLLGLPSAIQAFEQDYLSRLPALLRNPRQPDALIEDACQEACEKLLLATPKRGPKLARYTGWGSLLSWVRVTAQRIADKLEGSERWSSPIDEPDDLIKNLRADGLDPEGALLLARHKEAFRWASSEAISSLSPEDRYLLRLNVFDRLSTYKLAALFRVNQATISRRLTTVRQRVLKKTQRLLHARLDLSPDDFKSFFRVIKSQLDLSISRLMGEEDVLPLLPR